MLYVRAMLTVSVERVTETSLQISDEMFLGIAGHISTEGGPEYSDNQIDKYIHILELVLM